MKRKWIRNVVARAWVNQETLIRISEAEVLKEIKERDPDGTIQWDYDMYEDILEQMAQRRI